MFNFNKKGSALMQVLLVTVIVATIAAFLLRLSMSRAATVARTARSVNAKTMMDGCNAQVQTLLANGAQLNELPGSCTINGILINISVTSQLQDGETIQKISYSIAPSDLNKL